MSLSWKTGGLMLGLVFFLAVLLVKPIGVSTQFVILDAILWDVAAPEVIAVDESAKSGYASANPYLDKSGGKYAANAATPLNYSFVFVAAMVIGGAISAGLRGGVGAAERRAPAIWRARRGEAIGARLLVGFVGGVIVLFGARMAGGCTSGHMMSGMMQTAVSGFLFAACAFAAAIPTARLFYPAER